MANLKGTGQTRRYDSRLRECIENKEEAPSFRRYDDLARHSLPFKVLRESIPKSYLAQAIAAGAPVGTRYFFTL